MAHAHTVASVRYTFDSLADLLAKATPARSGDELAGIAATTAQQRVAAQRTLADLPSPTSSTKPSSPTRPTRSPASSSTPAAPLPPSPPSPQSPASP
ncbi:ethanolamine ammonia-lyase subunit EutB [Tunturiibacter gelidiferens]